VRSEWTGDDDDRPLEGIGQVQAQRMLSIYQAYGLTEIHTSDAIRCFDTVAGLARALGIEMAVTHHLSETTFKKNKEKALDYAKDLAESVGEKKQSVLLCSHNPILPRMLEKITKKSDLELPEEKLQPGDAWVVHIRKKKVYQIDVIKAPYAGTN
jgi:8-oxo-dGTP diphosphatase